MEHNVIFITSVLHSWQKCISQGLSSDIKKPQQRIKGEVLNQILTSNRDIINEFNNFMDAHECMIKSIKGIYNILLLDGELNLISFRYSSRNRLNINKSFTFIGVSYNELSIGTNAVSITKELKVPVYMHSQYNYSNLLKNYYAYCIPLKYKLNKTYYLCILNYKSPINKPLEGFLDLVGINICSDNSNYDSTNFGSDCLYSKDYLTAKQKLVLKKIAEGLSDQQISAELGISLTTVKSHNQSIFKYLNASNRADAILKAIISNELSLNEVCRNYI